MEKSKYRGTEEQRERKRKKTMVTKRKKLSNYDKCNNKMKEDDYRQQFPMSV